MTMLRKIILIVSVSMLSFAARSAHWTCNPYDYQYDMTAYVQLLDGGQAIADLSRYEVAALVGDECRGVVQWVAVFNGRTYGLARLWSQAEQGEVLRWHVYDAVADCNVAVYGSQVELPFVSQSVAGLPSAPISLDLQAHVRGDVTGDGRIDIADINRIINMMLGKVPGNEALTLGDVTSDGRIDIADVNAVINLMLGK